MADLTYRLVLRATFEGREQLEQAVQELDKIQFQGAKVGVTVGKGAKEAGIGMQSIARSAMSVGFMFNMLESAWMRQTMANIMASNAQDRYNSAVARYGVNSQEAQQAARQLTQEMQYLDVANMRANVSMGLMAGSMLISTGLLKEDTWATISHTASKYASIIATKLETAATDEGILAKIASKAWSLACAAATWIENAALYAKLVLQEALAPWMVPAMIVGVAAVAGVAGYYMGGGKQQGGFIEKEGLYHLHTGEKVLSKESVLKETFKSLQTGGFVEKEGVYHLHAGEKVLSKESAILYEKNNIEKSTFMGIRHDGGYVPQTGLYGLLAGEYVSKSIATTTLETSKAEVFNIQSDVHIETDLERALTIQNKKIVNEWKRMRP
jgi:hypothetical protein